MTRWRAKTNNFVGRLAGLGINHRSVKMFKKYGILISQVVDLRSACAALEAGANAAAEEASAWRARAAAAWRHAQKARAHAHTRYDMS